MKADCQSLGARKLLKSNHDCAGVENKSTNNTSIKQSCARPSTVDLKSGCMSKPQPRQPAQALAEILVMQQEKAAVHP